MNSVIQASIIVMSLLLGTFQIFLLICICGILFKVNDSLKDINSALTKLENTLYENWQKIIINTNN